MGSFAHLSLRICMNRGRGRRKQANWDTRVDWRALRCRREEKLQYAWPIVIGHCSGDDMEYLRLEAEKIENDHRQGVMEQHHSSN